MITYRAMLDVPTELVDHLARLLSRSRRARGTRRGARVLSCRQQAVFALVWFRERRPITLTGKGFGISQATAYRYLHEAIDVLAGQAPELREALERVAAEGWSHVILDGTVVDSDRVAARITSIKGQVIDVWYSGKKHGFGGNVQAVIRPDGFPVWASEVEPGSTHDLTCARDHALGSLYWAASQLGLPTLADAGYDGTGIGVHTPIKRPANATLGVDNRAYNQLLRGLRAQGERGFAMLTERWRALQRVSLDPARIADIMKAALVLTHYQHGYSTR
ncbi:MAG: transposase family protein [Acidimicrobiales bacterium]